MVRQGIRWAGRGDPAAKGRWKERHPLPSLLCSAPKARLWQPSTWPGQPRRASGWALSCAPAPAPYQRRGTSSSHAPGAPLPSPAAVPTLCCGRPAQRRLRRWCGWAPPWPPAAPGRQLARQMPGPRCPPRSAGGGWLVPHGCVRLAVQLSRVTLQAGYASLARQRKLTEPVANPSFFQALHYAEHLLDTTLRPVRLHALEPTPALKVGRSVVGQHTGARGCG